MASYATVLAIGALARAPMSSKDHVDEAICGAEEEALNASLTRLHLFEDDDILLAATEIDRELTRLPELARSKKWTRAEWRFKRNQLSDLTLQFEAIARRKLRSRRLSSLPSLYAPGGFDGPTKPTTP
jgi:hypothetical protein